MYYPQVIASYKTACFKIRTDSISNRKMVAFSQKKTSTLWKQIILTTLLSQKVVQHNLSKIQRNIHRSLSSYDHWHVFQMVNTRVKRENNQPNNFKDSIYTFTLVHLCGYKDCTIQQTAERFGSSGLPKVSSLFYVHQTAFLMWLVDILAYIYHMGKGWERRVCLVWRRGGWSY